MMKSEKLGTNVPKISTPKSRPGGGSTEWNSSPQTLQATTVVLNLLVDDPDTMFQQALQGGATTIFPLADQFYGYRSGRLQDPFGHQWILGKQIEQVSPEEMQRRMDQMAQ